MASAMRGGTLPAGLTDFNPIRSESAVCSGDRRENQNKDPLSPSRATVSMKLKKDSLSLCVTSLVVIGLTLDPTFPIMHPTGPAGETGGPQLTADS